MKCKDIERLIIESSEKDLSAEELFGIEQHISECVKCARFHEDLEKIRLYFKGMTLPAPPDELVRQTRLLCLAKIRTLYEAERKIAGQILLMRIPRLIWIALFSLTALTLVWIFPLIKDFSSDKPLSFQAVAVLFLMIQNAAMLFFTPLLIRRYRAKGQRLESL